MTIATAPLLQIFAREPEPGAVKTRLAAAIGAARAAAVYRELTTITLQNAKQARATGIVGAVELWCTPTTDSAWFRECATLAAASLHLQAGADLGARMRHALDDGRTRAGRVLLIGTDCPVVDGTALAAAGAMLRTHDAVLGPAEDGGFVLVGTCVPLHFNNVRMSSAHTTRDTLAAFGRAGIQCGLLPVSWDVDEAADLDRWQRTRARGVITA